MVHRKIKLIFYDFLKYWFSIESNIFKNCVDAILGGIIMIILPIMSLIITKFNEKITFSNYLFPIISICFAALYDVYGRYDINKKTSLKLKIRVFLLSISIFSSSLLYLIYTNKTNYFYYFPVLIMLFSGIIMLYEILYRIYVRFKIRR